MTYVSRDILGISRLLRMDGLCSAGYCGWRTLVDLKKVHVYDAKIGNIDFKLFHIIITFTMLSTCLYGAGSIMVSFYSLGILIFRFFCSVHLKFAVVGHMSA